MFGAFSRYDERFHLAQPAGILHTDHDLESGAVYLQRGGHAVCRPVYRHGKPGCGFCVRADHERDDHYSVGMSAGVLVVISGLLGAGDIKQAQDAAHTSVALYALMAAVMTVLGLLFVPQILRLVQTPAAAMPEAKRYLYTVFAGTVFTFGYNLIGALQRGLGNAAASMSFVIISSAANIALDAVFIVWLGMAPSARRWAPCFLRWRHSSSAPYS